MNNGTRMRTMYGKFATLLSYPEPGLADRAEALVRDLEVLVPEAAEPLAHFAECLASCSVEEAREHYTRAFDLSPLAVPYLSVYLFGAENPQRGQFMAGFSAAYAEAGHECGGELPDHLAVVLAYAAAAPEDTWNEVERFCLPAPLKLMRQSLETGGSPYRHLLASLEHVVKHETSGVLTHV